LKIAIVGNSPKVLEQDHGVFIDSHDIVIRCNKGTYKGYENHVGSRTDYRVINIHIANLLSNFEQMIQDKHFTDLFDDWADKKPEDIVEQNETVVLKDAVNYTYDKVKYIDFHQDAVGFAQINQLQGGLSVGGCAILFAKTMKYDSINCFGFSFYKDTNICSHYFEGVNNKVISHNHQREYDLFKSIEGIEFL
tara:strand:+ start:1581 stop:2159 length:579 start_codon:yes stop_codon:yes gene_type:complete